jgi:hypothetical protein
MSTRLDCLVIDAMQPQEVASFWATCLGWRAKADDDVDVRLTGSPDDIPIDFIRVDEPKLGKNRIHLDLRDVSVEKCLDLGATHVDIGQGDIPWTVLADPEGNEFCVLPPPHPVQDTGPLFAICLDADDVIGMRTFWRAATGWVDDRADPPAFVSLRAPSGRGPVLVMGPKVAAKHGKNRLHLDVAPPLGGDHHAEAERLIGLGATRADIGQTDVPWIVLADPEGNEFCVLTPRALASDDIDRSGS